MRTKIQKQIVPQYQITDPELAKKLNDLEDRAQEIFVSHYGMSMPEARPQKATLMEFMRYLLHLSRARGQSESCQESAKQQLVKDRQI